MARGHAIVRALAAVLLFLGAALDTVCAEGLADLTQSATEEFCSYGSRTPGSPGHDEARRWLKSRLEQIPGGQVWQEDFQVVYPVYTEATLRSGGESIRIHPLWPALCRLNIPAGGELKGPVVYTGAGEASDISPDAIVKSIAAMEMSGGGNWRTVAAEGARAILLLGSGAETIFDAHEHLSMIPVNMPRFYLPDGDMADRIRSGAVDSVEIRASGAWKSVRASNLYLLLKPEGVNAAAACCVTVPYDSMSIVPSLGEGADAAVDVGFALSYARELSKSPLARPVLFAFVDAWGTNHRGTREMLTSLGLDASERAEIRSEAKERVEEILGKREAAKEISAGLPGALAQLNEGKYIPLGADIRDEVSLRVTKIDALLEPLRLKRYDHAGEELARVEEEIQGLSLRRSRLMSVQRILLSDAELSDELCPIASDVWKSVADRIDREERERLADSEREEDRLRLRHEIATALGVDPDEGRVIGFLIGVDLSDAGVACGPSLFGAMLQVTEVPNTVAIREWMRRLYESKDGWPEEMRKAVNMAPVTSTEDFKSHTLGNLANISAPAASFGVPGVTWMTLSGYRLKVDTARDCSANLDWTRLGPQIGASGFLLDKLLLENSFKLPDPSQLPQWRRVTGWIVDQAVGEPLARLPMEGYVSTLLVGTAGGGQASPHYWWVDCAGMRRQEFVRSEADGRVSFDCLPGYVYAPLQTCFLQSFHVDDDGSISRAVDLSRSGKGVSVATNLGSKNPTPLRAQVFSCAEFNAYGMNDPRFHMPLPQAMVLDTATQSGPARLNMSFLHGVLSALVEPRVRLAVIGRTGIDNRFLMLNLPSEKKLSRISIREAIEGFAPGEPAERSSTLQSALDFHRLNGRRLDAFEEAGIHSEAIRGLQKEASAALAEADGTGAGAASSVRSISTALAAEVRAYRAVRETADDVVRGALFLLMMLVPFAFCMERLLFASALVYRRLAGMVGIFIAMAAVLWTFHPAFRISAQPLTIVLAFAIILMSVMVMVMVYSRFEADLRDLRRGKADFTGGGASQTGLLTTAVNLGIANMRKRPLRTVLTSTAIVLITFTLLCFSSTSTYTTRRENTIKSTAAYKGVLLRQPASRAIQREAYEYLRGIIGAEYPMAVRAWRLNPWDPDWRIHVRDAKSGAQVSLPAALGLSADEPRFTGITKALPHWDEFAQDGGCYLAAPTAEALGVKEGASVVVLGQTLRVVGVYDPKEVAAHCNDMDGEPILPLDYGALGRQQRTSLIAGDYNIEMLANEIQSGQGLEPLRQVPHLDPSSILIVPANMIGGGLGNEPFSIRSIAIGTKDEQAARTLAMKLVDLLAFPVFYGSEDGVKAVAGTPLLPKPPRSLFVPLLIAGMIILNTMLGSISERKREIYIYTSIGLAPVHVATLFLAEAATYGLMGSVFGYVAGQGVATVLGGLGWLGGLTLNYSGTQAIVTMSLVIGVTLISALVPAYLAGRLAAPSNRRSWAVPEPVDDVLADELPFTVTARTAPGVLQYLAEYFDSHRDGVVGHFTAEDVSVEGGLHGVVWLAPYDVGVRQRFRIQIAEAGDDDTLAMRILIERESGQTSAWSKLNKTFLSDVRQRLLGWRALTPEEMLSYIQKR